ncbi:MAG TPA: molybdopterin molybdenumtransferase MoeA, partial [Myxococcales bacterium]|nr:molybdopterin molybdenumtransferase MoeA [Myxococcales bacterium]
MTAKPEPKDPRSLPPWISVADALSALEAASPSAAPIRVPLSDACGYVLASDLRADADQPAFDRSMMDGIALRSIDCASPDAWVQELGQAPAGTPFTAQVGQQQCVRVMTGGVVPEGADAVVPVENIERSIRNGGTGYAVSHAVVAGRHIAKRGSEVADGAVVLRRGQRLTAARIGVLGSFGHVDVPVYARLRVSVIPTGSEIVSVTARPGLGQVRNSNAWALRAHFTQLGAEVSLRESVIDDQDVLDQVLSSAAAQSELLVTCGGVSMGDYDLVAGSLRRLGAQIVFHRVALKPGKPVLLARLGSSWVLGLPGNPVSAMTCAELFGRPLVSRLNGEIGARWVQSSVPVATPMRSTKARA